MLPIEPSSCRTGQPRRFHSSRVKVAGCTQHNSLAKTMSRLKINKHAQRKMGRLKINEKKAVQSLILFISLFVITLSLIGDKGIVQLHRLEQQESDLLREIEELKQKRQEWTQKVHSLKTNRTYLETLAREELKLIHKNEMLIQFEYADAETNPSK